MGILVRTRHSDLHGRSVARPRSLTGSYNDTESWLTVFHRCPVYSGHSVYADRKSYPVGANGLQLR